MWRSIVITMKNFTNLYSHIEDVCEVKSTQKERTCIIVHGCATNWTHQEKRVALEKHYIDNLW